MKTNSDQYFANEIQEQQTVAFVANEAITSVKTGDNWVQLSPYGRFPNASGMQVFTKQDAQNICNDFDSRTEKGVRATGIPFYIGHPDHEAFKDAYPDKRAYGRIKNLQAREDGLFANVRWSEDGKKLINDAAFHGHSVNWKMRRTGAEFHPYQLKSVGFTNDPQIPVEPITAANESMPNAPADATLPPQVVFARRQERVRELMAAMKLRFPKFSYDQCWQAVNRENPDLFTRSLK